MSLSTIPAPSVHPYVYTDVLGVRRIVPDFKSVRIYGCCGTAARTQQKTEPLDQGFGSSVLLALASLIVAGLAKQLGDLRLSNQQMVEAFAREINAAAAR